MTITRPSPPRFRDEAQKAAFGGKRVLLPTLVLLLLTSTTFIFYQLQKHTPSPERRRALAVTSEAHATTLIVYVFRNTDPESINNLFFFLANGVKEDDGARYLIALDPALAEAELPALPPLPPNAEYLRPPACFEMGVVGWLLYTSGKVKVTDYRHFVWVSSSVRGPFLPAYVQTAWHSILTDKLVAGVKLVGPTISCSILVVDTAQAPLQHPHVQTSVMATDKIGLELMKKVGALDCHNNWMDNKRFAEFGSSAAVLNAQYNLDSLMLRYQGVNWRDEETWKCNAQLDPQQHDLYDGTSLNPLEVMFLRMDFAGLVAELPAMQQAHLYSEWMDADRQPRRRQVNGNAWLQKAAKLREAVMAKPRACFDAEFYIMASSAEFKGYTADRAYEHFQATGFREGRPYLFLC